MGAGFGHSYEIGTERYPALAFALYDTELEGYDFDETGDALAGVIQPALSITVRGYTLKVGLALENTYNGDDICIVPASDMREIYADEVESSSSNPHQVDWVAVLDGVESDLREAFENAIVQRVAHVYPDMFLRRRIFGWSGTAYVTASEWLAG